MGEELLEGELSVGLIRRGLEQCELLRSDQQQELGARLHPTDDIGARPEATEHLKLTKRAREL